MLKEENGLVFQCCYCGSVKLNDDCYHAIEKIEEYDFKQFIIKGTEMKVSHTCCLRCKARVLAEMGGISCQKQNIYQKKKMKTLRNK